MALFNKLFAYRKNNCCNQEKNSGEKQFNFNKDQVRVVLFRECDFRGRKLLFDSTAIKKVQMSLVKENENDATEGYAEICDGFGYMFIKPPPDTSRLREMIFGLVAMSYRGAYFKIHNLDTPPRLMLTQVFPSPKYGQRRKVSVSSHGFGRNSSQSLEHSVRLEDSGTSISDHSSVHSTASDTLLVYRHSLPVEVPQKLSASVSSVICDSGVYGERSCSSCEGNRMSNTLSFWESVSSKGNIISFSNSTLYKRWLRSSSLDHSVSSSNGSLEESFSKAHQRSSKLGLAFIIQLTSGSEKTQVQFLMEHIALLESMLFRARRATEVAYLKPNNFLSVLVKMVDLTSTWLAQLLAGPLLSTNLWTCLGGNILSDATGCDNNNSITTCEAEKLFSSSCELTGNDSETKTQNVFTLHQWDRPEFSFHSLTKLIRNEWDILSSKVFANCDRRNLAGKFVQEFCELLETIDVKDTKFFISTLLTAVLTHHLGWVATCLPLENDEQPICDLNIPFNPLWGQLGDLYGAVGHPTRVAQTIILSNRKKELVTKIINCLTYFIRCSDVEKNIVNRSNVDDENRTADYICHKASCIPKENYKKYKDHLREMLCTQNYVDLKKTEKNTSFKKTEKGLSRTKKSIFDLKTLDKPSEDLEDTKCNPLSNHKDLTVLDELNNDEKNVVFVLGDDDRLVNIKKKNIKKDDDKNIYSTQNFFDLIFKKYESFEEEFSKSQFKDDDFVKCETNTCIKPSTSWASLPQAEEESLPKLTVESDDVEKPFTRSQSVPPEDKETKVKEEVKAKYKYSGIKFNLQQYPQVVTNYMRSKNLEMANLSFSEITKKFDQFSLENEEVALDFSQSVNSAEMEALQTPSNASDLEFTSYPMEPKATTAIKEEQHKDVRKYEVESNVAKMKIIHFPLPSSNISPTKPESLSYSVSLLRGINDCYIPNLVLQGTSAPRKEWESYLRSELALSSQQCVLDQRVEEAVAIIADIDTWEVQLVSSHTYVIDKTSPGVKVGMSQLISSMLDSLLKMWKLQVPPELCLMHIEQRLQALCVTSKAVAQLLLATEFCSMEFLTSTLHLEVNDVPLLLAVASTFSPQVTQKYGISFH